jgi:hypothetical protein
MEVEVDFNSFVKVSFFQILSTGGKIELMFENPTNKRNLMLWF